MAATFPLAALLPGASHATAQARPPIPVGARVRAWVPAAGRPKGWLVGTAVAVGRDEIEIREATTGRSWSVPFIDGPRLEISRGMQTQRSGGVAGAVGGFVLGETAGVLLRRPTSGESGNLGTRTFELLRSGKVLVVGVAGGVAGYFVGRRIRSERWDLVTPPAGLGVLPHAPGLAIRFAWQ